MHRLAQEDDLPVRLLIAHNHPDARADPLLDAFLRDSGPSRRLLTARLNFPKTGLAHLAEVAAAPARPADALRPA